MERKNRQVIGRSIVLERQETFSYETSERIYLNRLYHNPSFDIARISSSSDDIEKIHRTRERVDSLNDQINFEIKRLKEINNSLNNKKDESLMTWAERFRANPPLTNVLNKQHGPGHPDDVLKPGTRKVKQNDDSPRKPPPKGLPPNGISLNELPPRGPSPKEIPKELTTNGLPPKGPWSKGHPKERIPKRTPPISLPQKELPPKELPPKELTSKKPPPRVLPAKEIPLKGLALKELNPRKPTTGVLPPKELPPKGLQPKSFPPRGLPPKIIPPKRVPSKTIPPKAVPSKTNPPKAVPSNTIPSKGVPPKTIPSKGVLPKTIPPKGVPPKTIPSKGVLPKTIPPKGVPSRTIPPTGVPSKTIPPKGVLPKTIPPKVVPSKTIPPKGVPSKTIPLKGVPSKTIPLKGVPSKTIPPKGVAPKEITLRKPPSKVIPPNDFPAKDLPAKDFPAKDLPAKNLPARRLPLKELPSKKTPPKAPMTSKAPPKMSTQKDLKPGKPPPKDVAPKEPIQKKEPMQGSLGKAAPEELAARISGGCCNCYCHYDQCCWPTYEDSCHIATDCHCNMGFNEGIQYGIPYCTARRRVTDLNTQEICSNRCVGISPERKSSKKCNSIRESTRNKRKIPVRSGSTSPSNKMRNQQKLPKDESQEKVKRVTNLGERPENIMTKLRNDFYPPVNIQREKPKAPKTVITKLDVSPIPSPTKDQKISVDERMYEDYLSLYFQENSKSDLLESPRPTPTYTRLPEETARKDEGQSVTVFKDRQEVKPPISNQKIWDSQQQKISICLTERYPGPFRYEECFEEQNNRSPVEDRQEVRTESVMAREDSTSYASLPVKLQSGTPTTRQASTTTETQRSKPRSLLTYPTHFSEKSTQVNNDRQSNLSSGPPSSRKTRSPTTDLPRLGNLSPFSFIEGSSQMPQSQTTDSRRQNNSRPTSFREESSQMPQSPTTDSRRQNNSSPISFKANSSRIAPSQTTESAGDTMVMIPHYQTEETQSSSKQTSNENSNESSEYDPRFDTQLLKVDVFNRQRKHANENTDFEDAFSTLNGNETPHVSFGKEFSIEFQDSEMNEAEESEEPFRTTPNDSSRREFQLKARYMDNNEYKNRYYSSPTDDIQSRCECNGYETARSIDSSRYPYRSGDESPPIGKRTRTVTFKDEQGDLRLVEEECCSPINWEQALSYRSHNSSFSNDNYTSYSSSSAEHTCLESSCDEEDAYDSCFESPFQTDEQMPSFKACPCMYETYCQLAALCQSKSPYYR